MRQAYGAGAAARQTAGARSRASRCSAGSRQSTIDPGNPPTSEPSLTPKLPADTVQSVATFPVLLATIRRRLVFAVVVALNLVIMSSCSTRSEPAAGPLPPEIAKLASAFDAAIGHRRLILLMSPT